MPHRPDAHLLPCPARPPRPPAGFLPKSRQTLLFSATMPQAVQQVRSSTAAAVAGKAARRGRQWPAPQADGGRLLLLHLAPAGGWAGAQEAARLHRHHRGGGLGHQHAGTPPCRAAGGPAAAALPARRRRGGAPFAACRRAAAAALPRSSHVVCLGLQVEQSYALVPMEDQFTAIFSVLRRHAQTTPGERGRLAGWPPTPTPPHPASARLETPRLAVVCRPPLPVPRAASHAGRFRLPRLPQ